MKMQFCIMLLPLLITTCLTLHEAFSAKYKSHDHWKQILWENGIRTLAQSTEPYKLLSAVVHDIEEDEDIKLESTINEVLTRVLVFSAEEKLPERKPQVKSNEDVHPKINPKIEYEDEPSRITPQEKIIKDKYFGGKALDMKSEDNSEKFLIDKGNITFLNMVKNITTPQNEFNHNILSEKILSNVGKALSNSEKVISTINKTIYTLKIENNENGFDSLATLEREPQVNNNKSVSSEMNLSKNVTEPSKDVTVDSHSHNANAVSYFLNFLLRGAKSPEKEDYNNMTTMTEAESKKSARMIANETLFNKTEVDYSKKNHMEGILSLKRYKLPDPDFVKLVENGLELASDIYNHLDNTYLINNSFQLANKESSKLRIVVDTDCAADDAVALFMLLGAMARDENIKVEAITVTAGKVSMANATKNVYRVLQASHKQEIPVWEGEENGLVLPIKPDFRYGSDGFGDFYTDDPPQKTIKEGHAAAALVNLVKQNPGKITVIALGPVKNIALASMLDPTFLKNLAHLYIFGGSTSRFPSPREFNFHADPTSAQILLSQAKKVSNGSVTILPFEPAEREAFEMDWRIHTLGRHNSSAIEMMNRAENNSLQTRYWSPNAAMLVGLSLGKISATTKAFDVNIVQCGDVRGRMILNQNSDTCSSSIHIVEDLDTRYFSRYLLNTLVTWKKTKLN